MSGLLSRRRKRRQSGLLSMKDHKFDTILSRLLAYANIPDVSNFNRTINHHFSDLCARACFRFGSLTLLPLEAAGFLLHCERPAVAGLTFAPQAFNVSVCPTATSILTPSSLTFFAAL